MSSEIAKLASEKGAALTRPHIDVADRTAKISTSIEVKDPGSFDLARRFLLSVKAEAAKIEAEKKQVCGPFADALRNLRSYFDKPLDMLASVETSLKGKLATYDRAIVAGREAQAKAGLPVIEAPPIAEAEGLSKVMVRKWRIVDEAMVGRQWCSPDPAKINAHLRAGGLEAIPGVEFYDEVEIRASRRGVGK
jgi:hypothetical protein